VSLSEEKNGMSEKLDPEEAHQYFQKAFDILAPKEDKSEAEKILLIDTLNSWGSAYYYLGDVKNFIDRFSSYQDLAESLNNQAKLGAGTRCGYRTEYRQTIDEFIS
jgi:hypothetical protein